MFVTLICQYRTACIIIARCNFCKPADLLRIYPARTYDVSYKICEPGWHLLHHV